MLTDLKTDPKMIENLVEIITHEVLVAMLEQKEKAQAPEGAQCKFNCSDALCVRTCFDRAGKVVSAGAERLSSTIGIIPQDQSLARTIDHTLLKPDATRQEIEHLCREAAQSTDLRLAVMRPLRVEWGQLGLSGGAAGRVLAGILGGHALV